MVVSPVRGNVSAYRRIGVLRYRRIGVRRSKTAFRHGYSDQKVSTKLITLCKRRPADPPIRRYADRFPLTDFPPVAFLVVLVDFSAFFVPGFLMRSVAKRLVLGETAHADPNRRLLRLYLKRSLGGFKNFAHNPMVKIEWKQNVELQPVSCPRNSRYIAGDRTLGTSYT